MVRRRELLSHTTGAAFRVGDVAFHGTSPQRLRGRDLERPFHGVRSSKLDLDDVIARCRAYEPLLSDGEAFSHETAARLYGLPLPHGIGGESSGTWRARTEALHVTGAPRSARARSAGVVGHVSGRSLPQRRIGELPVLTPAIVWCQLGNALSHADLVAVGDAIVTGRRRGTVRQPGLAQLHDLDSVVRVWGRRRGAVAVSRALPFVRVGAESRPETHLRLLLLEWGFPEPLINHPVTLGSGVIRHPDLQLPEWRIALEYLGDQHRTGRGRWQQDVRRRRAFETARWRVVDVTADDLYSDSRSLRERLAQLVVGASAIDRGQ